MASSGRDSVYQTFTLVAVIVGVRPYRHTVPVKAECSVFREHVSEKQKLSSPLKKTKNLQFFDIYIQKTSSIFDRRVWSIEQPHPSSRSTTHERTRLARTIPKAFPQAMADRWQRGGFLGSLR